MYLAYWNLKEKPFDNTPDRRFLYRSRNHEDAWEKLLWAITGGKPCAMLSGEYGCGKTVLMRAIAAQLEPSKFNVALINYPLFEGDGFLRDIIVQFGHRPTSEDRSGLFQELSQKLMEVARSGKRSLLIIDEAQVVEEPQVFDDLRLLADLHPEAGALLSVVLVGQPELRELVGRYPLLEQHISVRCHLHRFDLRNTARYVSHRLSIAGGQAGLFSEEALELVHRHSGGIPRRINNVADLCLLEACRRQAQKVDGEIVNYLH